METPPATDLTAHPTVPPSPPGPGDAAVAGAHDVFLSYKSSDHAYVERLAEALRAQGLVPFLDRWDLTHGRPWRPELELALAHCRAVAVLLGPDGLGDVQEREVDVALRRQDRDRLFRVVPVLLPGSQQPTGFLETLTWVDLRQTQDQAAAKHLANVLRGGWSPDASRTASRRERSLYLGNLALLLVTLVLAAVWYYRHLEGWWGQWALGGTLTLAALARFTLAYLKWSAEREVRDLPRRLLAGRHSRRFILALLALVLVATLGTSSVHLQLDPGPDAARTLRLQLHPAGASHPTVSRTLTSARPRATLLFFSGFRRAWQLDTDAREGRNALPLGFRPASRIEISVPSGLPLRPLVALRLLPGPGLAVQVGRSAESVLRHYDLLITHGDQTQRLSGYRAQTLLVAADPADATLALQREGPAPRGERLRAWARDHTALPDAANRDILVSAWEAMPRTEVLTPLHALPPDALQFSLLPEDSQEMLRLQATVLDATNEIRTLLLEL
ncbi:MAG: toll/interleukin-1 receptor domain-containing protein [Verrucomicrobiales bacterium]|nr:toll/interleukin-1 receptor domain-containing protein [Verrucomicrobiales bacterium]